MLPKEIAQPNCKGGKIESFALPDGEHLPALCRQP
jgi:hypothetical protein